MYLYLKKLLKTWRSSSSKLSVLPKDAPQRQYSCKKALSSLRRTSQNCLNPEAPQDWLTTWKQVISKLSHPKKKRSFSKPSPFLNKLLKSLVLPEGEASLNCLPFLRSSSWRRNLFFLNSGSTWRKLSSSSKKQFLKSVSLPNGEAFQNFLPFWRSSASNCLTTWRSSSGPSPFLKDMKIITDKDRTKIWEGEINRW